MIRRDRSKTLVKKRTCPECGHKKAGIRYGVMACFECGYVYPKVEKDEHDNK